MNTCPLYTNKKVKKEFNDIVTALGGRALSDDEFRNVSARDSRTGIDRNAAVAAYKIWDLTNGNGITKAPNGLPSELFLSLLTHFNGDVIQSIQAKANMLSDAFISDFGAYTNGEDGFKLPLDLNGEPILETLGDLYIQTLQLDLYKKQAFYKAFDLDDDSIELHFIEDSPFATGQLIHEYLSQNNLIPKELKNIYDKAANVPFNVKFTLGTNNTYMVTDPDSHSIYISTRAAKETNSKAFAEAFAHELVHVTADWALDSDPTFKKNITDYLSLSKKSFTKLELLEMRYGDLYGLKDEHEFVAEFMSNPRFRLSLRKVNLFQRVINAIKDVFKSLRDGNISAAHALVMSKEQLTNLSNRLLEIIQQGAAPNRAFSGSLASILREDLKEYDTNRLNKAYKLTKDGIESRIKSLSKRPNISKESIDELKVQLSKLQKMDAREGIIDFVYNLANATVKQAASYLLDNKIQELSSKELNQLQKDFLGFYSPLMHNIKSILDSTDELKDIEKDFPDISYDDLYDTVNHMLNQIDILKSKYEQAADTKSRQWIKQLAEANHDTTYRDFFDWLDNGDKDISWFSNWVGMASGTANTAIRAADNAIRNGKIDAQLETFNFGKRLVSRYAKLQSKYGQDFIKQFFEKDSNGDTTGNFVTQYNRGEWDLNYKKFRASLVDKFDLQRDEDGYPVLPEKGDPNFDKVWKAIDDWHEKNSSRKYTRQFYELLRSLSFEARTALDDVQIEKNRILNKVYLNGVHHLENLSLADVNQLDALDRKRAQLMSPFDNYGNEKTGIDKDVSQELTLFYQKLNENVKYKRNETEFNKQQLEVLDKYGKDSVQYRRWMERNTEYRIDDALYTTEPIEKILNLKDPEQKELYNLIQKRRAILKPFKNQKHLIYGYDLGLVPSGQTSNLKKNLGEIDSRISELKHKLGLKGDQSFFDNFKVDLNKEFEKEFSRRYLLAKQSGENFYDTPWYKENTYIKYTNKGLKRVPLTLYDEVKPAKVGHLLRVPNSTWSELDMDSAWANKNYNGDGHVMPNTKVYDNSTAYNKIAKDPELKKFYDELIQHMRDSVEMIPFMNQDYQGKMPQISGRLMSILGRNGNIFKNLGYYIKDNFKIKDDDIDYVEKYDVRPDGSAIRNVPTRFIKTLDDPRKITSDLIGGIISFREMANNFKHMSMTLNDLELLLDRMRLVTYHKGNKYKGPGTLNAVKKMEKYLDMNLYGKRKDEIEINVGGQKVNLTKFLVNFKEYTSMVNLSMNPWPIAQNLISGDTYAALEASLGRYFDKDDFLFAAKLFTKYLPNAAMNLGNKMQTNYLMALCEYNLISRSNLETFERLDQSPVLRAINSHFWYNGYNFGDFAMKSKILASVYHSFRFVTNNDGTLGFMKKSDFIAKNFSNDKKEGERKFKQFNNTLYDAYYEAKDHQVLIKPEYQKYIDRNMERHVANLLNDLCTKVDGNLSEYDRAAVFANPFTAYIVQHKGVFIRYTQDRFKSKQYNYNTWEMEEGYYRTIPHLFRNLFSLGKLHVLKLLLDNYKNMEDYELYNVRRVVKELGLIAATTLISSCFICQLANTPDWKDNWGMQALAYLALRSAFEFRTMYNPLELVNTFLSPTASMSTILNMVGLIKLIWIPGYFMNQGPFDPITSGPYEGMTRFDRSMIKATPFRSLIEFPYTKQLKSKRQYLENQLMF